MSNRKIITEKAKRNFRITRYVIYKETAIDAREQSWSFLGAFIGIGLIAFIQSYQFSRLENILLIGSFGAASVLIFGAIQSPLAQPRNFIGGQLISAVIGVSVFKFLPDILWITAPLAVATSIIVMQMTRTLHPPGGATALIAVIGTEKIKSLGYLYVISPVFTGTFILFITAIMFNNMTKYRSYPTNKKWTRIFKSKSAQDE
ncbi:HPP family protein [Aquimarina muelleri]|uniref:Membrane protein n=1 Tax=Aquimarina muelleri TaxID=279356 RepID=A0A918JS97_9FLAO|nr:HPP family protein [Aquimarina muelleri]MCX2763115.1 HPP family protein [Aquimarina muelleri]GGX06543.1 membrane protein [Aquimarina muelleri]